MSEIDNSCQRAFAQLLKVCAIDVPVKGKARAKRKTMSGYNCFVRVMSKRGNKSVIKSRAWSQLEDKQKETWKRTAKQGCSNPRLWEEKL